jgi:hypothetical protein
MSSLGFFALVSIAVEHQDGSWSEVNKLTVRASPQDKKFSYAREYVITKQAVIAVLS